jgi:hypothetical protein
MDRLTELPDQLLSQIDMLVEVIEAQAPQQPLDNLCNQVSDAYRAMGICLLLGAGEVDAFFHLLIQSALTRRFYLQRNGPEQLADPYRRTSLSGPYFDAVAANQWELAQQIAELSPTSWWEGEEYEDDFAYARAMHLLGARKHLDRAALGRALEQMARALEGAESPRFEIARALASKDQKTFDGAFEALLDKHEQTYIEEERSTLALEITFEPNRRLTVEGLAILRMAESFGLKTQPEYRFCPRLARGADYAPFEPVGFPDVLP